MKKSFLLFSILLCSCTGIPEYNYETTNILDTDLKQEDTCIVIDNDNSLYERGTQMLPVSPFAGEEGYSSNNVKKDKSIYNHNFDNDVCSNPISITREISVSGIVYPGVCSDTQYAGSIPMGGNTYTYGNTFGGFYSGSSITNTYSVPVYNNYNYSCTQARYFTEIRFYKGKKYLGQIKDVYWNDNDTDETIDKFTEEFIEKLEQDQKTTKK